MRSLPGRASLAPNLLSPSPQKQRGSENFSASFSLVFRQNQASLPLNSAFYHQECLPPRGSTPRHGPQQDPAAWGGGHRGLEGAGPPPTQKVLLGPGPPGPQSISLGPIAACSITFSPPLSLSVSLSVSVSLCLSVSVSLRLCPSHPVSQLPPTLQPTSCALTPSGNSLPLPKQEAPWCP